MCFNQLTIFIDNFGSKLVKFQILPNAVNILVSQKAMTARLNTNIKCMKFVKKFLLEMQLKPFSDKNIVSNT